MASIDGGTGSGGTQGAAAAVAAQPGTDAPATSEQRLAAALLRCMGRWGLAKTTIEDIAREAGMSRATAYRLYPGGKTAILDAAMATEIHRLMALIEVEAAHADDLAECLTRVVCTASRFLRDHDALRFVREHEPVVFEQYLGFERLEFLYGAAGELLVPALSRFFDHDGARATGVWLTRLVLSYLQTPSPVLDPAEPGGARRLVEAYVLPGLAGQAAPDHPPTDDGPSGSRR